MAFELSSRLLVWAFRPAGGSLRKRLLRGLAQSVLRVSRDPDFARGVRRVRLFTRSVTALPVTLSFVCRHTARVVHTASRNTRLLVWKREKRIKCFEPDEFVTPVVEIRTPLQKFDASRRRFAPEMAEWKLAVLVEWEPAVSQTWLPDSPPEPTPDPEVDAQLEVVTEPYILWDARKPPYSFPTDCFYDSGEVLAPPPVPAYRRAVERLPQERLKVARDAFADLICNRECFKLPLDDVVFRSLRQRPRS